MGSSDKGQPASTPSGATAAVRYVIPAPLYDPAAKTASSSTPQELLDGRGVSGAGESGGNSEYSPSRIGGGGSDETDASATAALEQVCVCVCGYVCTCVSCVHSRLSLLLLLLFWLPSPK